MDCPKCGTWNPDDKQVCWRCQAPMPKPAEKKKARPVVFLGLPLWTWVVVILMFVSIYVVRCLATGQLGGQ